MLDDRYYMRSGGFNSRRSATVTLLIVLAVAFVVQLAVEHWLPRFPLMHYLALSSDGLAHGKIWQLVTFQFLHGGWLHLLLNCWMLYVFGRELEETLGVQKFLTLYFLSGIAGGLLQAIGGWMIGGNFAGNMVGASAGVFGLVAAFASMHPERPLTLLLFFIIPVTIKAKVLLWILAGIALLGILFPGDNIAHTAHLGGMIMGLAFVKHGLNWQWPQRSRTRSEPSMVKVRTGPRLSKPQLASEASPDEFLAKEVDPILDKISAHGIQSLTEKERQILDAARKRVGKR